MYEEPKVNFTHKGMPSLKSQPIDCSSCGSWCFMCMLDPGASFNGQVMQGVWGP